MRVVSISYFNEDRGFSLLTQRKKNPCQFPSCFTVLVQVFPFADFLYEYSPKQKYMHMKNSYEEKLSLINGN